MKIAYIGGSWSSNIGNSFYNIGTDLFLKKIGSTDHVFIPEVPQWASPNVNNDFDPIGYLDVDLVIFTGPCLNLKIEGIYKKTFDLLQKRKIPIAFLSAGMSIYDAGEAMQVRTFLDRYKPSFIFTRDDHTATFLKAAGIANVHKGICMSFYLNEGPKYPELAMGEYVVLKFDEEEPVIHGDEFSGFSTEKRTWRNRNAYPERINGLEVVRTRNDSITAGAKYIYSRNNSYHSDLPFGYLTILKNAKYVLSERVHTCAASIVLGSAAQYIPHSTRSLEKRVSLFEKIGLKGITSKPCKIDSIVLDKEKNKLEAMVKESFQK